MLGSLVDNRLRANSSKNFKCEFSSMRSFDLSEKMVVSSHLMLFIMPWKFPTGILSPIYTFHIFHYFLLRFLSFIFLDQKNYSKNLYSSWASLINRKPKSSVPYLLIIDSLFISSFSGSFSYLEVSLSSRFTVHIVLHIFFECSSLFSKFSFFDLNNVKL